MSTQPSNSKELMTELAIRTEHLTKIYSQRLIAVNDMNLEVPRGSVFGLLGPNGAGKTTTLRLLLGLQRPTAGQAQVFGKSCGPNAVGVRSQIGYLPTNPKLPGNLRPIEYLDLLGKLSRLPSEVRKPRIRLWLGATVLLTLLLVGSNWSNFMDGTLIASLLFPYLVFPWFFIVVVLGVTPVSGSQAETLADGILCRPVSRFEYLLASWSARVVLVLSVYLVGTIPAIVLVILAKRPVPEDTVTVYGIITALGVVGLVLTFLVSLGFLAGTLLRKPLLAVVVLIFIWYPIGLILSIFSLEEFSPISLNRAISTQLRRPWRETDAEAKNNAKVQDTDVFPDQVSNFFNVLSGAPSKPKATKPDFFEGEKFDDFSLFRVTLGYGLPTIASVILASLCFYWRDL